MPSTGYVWMGSWGCLLPLLIIFNLFFGKLIFNSTRLWLGIEAVLILIFILKINVMATKISQQFGQQGRGLASDKPQGNGLASNGQSHSQSHKSEGKVIDVEGEVVEEKQKLK